MASKQGFKAVTAAATAASGGHERHEEIGHELRAATAAADAEEIGTARHNLRFQLLEGVAYHAIREQFLARLNRFLTGLQVLLGTGAIGSMLDVVPVGASTLVIISTVAGVLLLVIDPAGGAREHRSFRGRLQAILADIEERDTTLDDIRKGRALMLRVAGEAPPAFRAVSAIAYNTAVNAIYPEEQAAAQRYRVGFLRRLFANWVPMRGFQFKRERG